MIWSGPSDRPSRSYWAGIERRRSLAPYRLASYCFNAPLRFVRKRKTSGTCDTSFRPSRRGPCSSRGNRGATGRPRSWRPSAGTSIFCTASIRWERIIGPSGPPRNGVCTAKGRIPTGTRRRTCRSSGTGSSTMFAKQFALNLLSIR